MLRNLLNVQNEAQIRALKPNPFGAELECFPDPDQMLPVSVAHSDSKLMAVRDIKAMSWEQHINMWKVGIFITKHAHH